jgi:hypothetical protein
MVSLFEKDRSSMSAEALAAIRTVWPRHTAKHMSRKWGRAVVTMKLWLSKGIPEYQLQMILADLEKEMGQHVEELTARYAALRRARLEEKITRTRRAARDAAGEVRSLACQTPETRP